jgi:DnaK suppressor protein
MNRIKSRLLDQRRDLMSRYHDALARVVEELDSREIEQVENATELWDARLLSRLSDADAQRLARIVGALRRLEDGSYGMCVECGAAIGAARLAAVPETDSCYACARDASQPASFVRAAR